MAEAPKKPSYLKAAFTNLLNLNALAAVAVASVATGQAWIAGAGLVAESIWLAAVPASRRFRRAIDARHLEERRQFRRRAMQEESALLPGDLRARVHHLLVRVDEIRQEVERRGEASGAFLEGELARLDDVLADYVHLSVTAFRAQSHLAKADVRSVQRERDQQQKLEAAATDEATRELARRTREVLEKRLRIFEELATFLQRAKAQQMLLENTVSLVREQVLTMSTPDAISAPLDGLVTTLDAMREAVHEVEALVNPPLLATPGEGSDASSQAGDRTRERL